MIPVLISDDQDSDVVRCTLREFLRDNGDEGDNSLVRIVRQVWRSRDRLRGRSIATLRIGGGAMPWTTITFHRFRLT